MSMTYGTHVPQYGRVASGEAVARAARHAEDLGFADVWVSDHVVHPAEQTYPSPFLLDPFATLSWAAAVTSRVRLGFHVVGLKPPEVIPVVERLRRDRPEPSFIISARTGWDPQGMDPGLIAEENAAYEAAGVQHMPHQGRPTP